MKDRKPLALEMFKLMQEVQREGTKYESGWRETPHQGSYLIVPVDGNFQLVNYKADTLPPYVNPDHRNADIDKWVSRLGAKINSPEKIERYFNMACYDMLDDEITMPDFEVFRSSDCYYATLFHELTHWTQKPTGRLRDIESVTKTESIREEVIAEFGAFFLCRKFGLTSDSKNLAIYINNYMKLVAETHMDPIQILVSCAFEASRAVDYLEKLGDGD